MPRDPSDSPRFTPLPPDLGIRVSAKGRSTPFSKGVLSQSLLSTALDPEEASELARRIELEIGSTGARDIARSDLRALVRRVLADEVGREAAERYHLWRDHEERERPLLLLLGGTSGVGKSALALEVGRRLGIARMLSTDSIRQVMRVLLSQALVPAIYSSSYDACKLLPRTDGQRPSVTDGFRAQASAVGVAVKGSLDRAVAEHTPLVIEGVSIAPGLIDLEAFAGTADVVFLVVTVSAEQLRNRLVDRATGQPRRLPDRYLENFDAILEIQQHLVELAARHHVAVIDNESLDDSARRVVEYVMETLRAVYPTDGPADTANLRR